MELIYKIANEYVSWLRCLYFIHQHCHWIYRGNNFYAMHLLFERLYKSAAENADLAAEKMIGLLNVDTVNYKEQKDNMNKILSNYDLTSNIVKTALKAEKDFLDFSKKIYQLFDKAGIMTMGLDDALSSIASKREEAVYLLKQTLNNLE